MTFRIAIIASLICLLFSVVCYADSLVITYHSGKTQKVLLDDSIQSINTLQYLSSAQAENNKDASSLKKPGMEESKTVQPDSKPETKSNPDKKAKVKFKWAKPLSGE